MYNYLSFSCPDKKLFIKTFTNSCNCSLIQTGIEEVEYEAQAHICGCEGKARGMQRVSSV